MNFCLRCLFSNKRKIWSLMSLKGLRYFMEVHTYFSFNRDRKSVKALHRGMSQNCRWNTSFRTDPKWLYLELWSLRLTSFIVMKSHGHCAISYRLICDRSSIIHTSFYGDKQVLLLPPQLKQPTKLSKQQWWELSPMLLNFCIQPSVRFLHSSCSVPPYSLIRLVERVLHSLPLRLKFSGWFHAALFLEAPQLWLVVLSQVCS